MLVSTRKGLNFGLLREEPRITAQNPINSDDMSGLLEVDSKHLVNCQIESIEILLELLGQALVIDFLALLGGDEQFDFEVEGGDGFV